MRRLVTLCLGRCQGLVHEGDVVLRVEDDGTVTALDRDGKVIGMPRSAAEVLAEADENCPLETIELQAAETAPAAEELPEASAETERCRTLDSLDDLPPELTASQWRALEGRIDWSPTHHAFLFRPDGRDLTEFLAAPGEAPPPPSTETPAGIRPVRFEDFVGQRRVVENLLLAARAAKERGESLGHVLLSGQAGIGKTTTARLLAREYGAGLVEVLGMNVGDPHQLVSLLCRLPRFGFINIDEIHRLEEACQESLYSALEDGVLDVILREGGKTRAVRVRLEPFTLVGATTRPGKLSPPLRDRFRLQERLDPYGESELAEVVAKAAARLGATASPEAALEVARRARGTPRLAIRLLERARDVAQLALAPIRNGRAGSIAGRAEVRRQKNQRAGDQGPLAPGPRGERQTAVPADPGPAPAGSRRPRRGASPSELGAASRRRGGGVTRLLERFRGSRAATLCVSPQSLVDHVDQQAERSVSTSGSIAGRAVDPGAQRIADLPVARNNGSGNRGLILWSHLCIILRKQEFRRRLKGFPCRARHLSSPERDGGNFTLCGTFRRPGGSKDSGQNRVKSPAAASDPGRSSDHAIGILWCLPPERRSIR
jgi:Holliday junction DNA helicase RuvB subunit